LVQKIGFVRAIRAPRQRSVASDMASRATPIRDGSKAQPTRIFFVDDSGDPTIAVLAAISFELSEWRRIYSEWLGWRRWMWKHYRLPADFELHAREFLSGRGEISYRDSGRITQKPLINSVLNLRQEAYRRSLVQINRQEGVSVLAVAWQGRTIAEAYAWFIAELDQLLADLGEEAIIVVDGLDDSSYRPAHRQLHIKSRRIIEDPLLQSSRHSQLIQMADLVAYAAFQHLAADPEKRFMWDWYPALLANSVFAAEWGRKGIWRPE
jgi:hypothetical protein